MDELRVKLQFGGYHHLVESRHQRLLDNLSHEWLMRMLAEPIDDEPFLRLIKKWLKAGVLDTDGKVLRPESGIHQRWLNQRSQRRSHTWAAYTELMRLLALEQPRIVPRG